MEKLHSDDLQLKQIKERINKCRALIENLMTDIEKYETTQNVKEEERNHKPKLLLTWEEKENLLGIGYTSLKKNLEEGKIKRVHLSENRKPFKYEDVIKFVNNLDYIDE